MFLATTEKRLCQDRNIRDARIESTLEFLRRARLVRSTADACTVGAKHQLLLRQFFEGDREGAAAGLGVVDDDGHQLTADAIRV